MTSARTITRENLAVLVDELRRAGVEVIAPARRPDGSASYAPIGSLDEAAFDGPLPCASLKEFFLPPSEPLLSWRQSRAGLEIQGAAPAFAPRVILGARPCDAAALEIVDRVMDWDWRDDLWFGRREATTVVSLVCDAADASCFCGAVGLGPEARRGADLQLTRAEGGWRVEIVTPRGEALMAAHADCFSAASPTPASAAAAVPLAAAPFAPAAVRDWLEAHFEDPLWADIALRCHGCGACAAVCPTCHCFDIVDEPEGVAHGTRRRHWDTCQSGRFTVHASGHNPRADQTARLRQRVMHKFAIYPRKFGEVLCTGCGRCARACPAGTDLPEILCRIAARACPAGTDLPEILCRIAARAREDVS